MTSPEHDRARVLAAARTEFTERGYRSAELGLIAARAGLTGDAVQSHFPGKQALYFSVLAEAAEQAPEPAYPPTARTAEAALGDFARAWLARLPLATDEQRSPARLGRDLLPEVLADERTSQAYAQLSNLTAIVLGLALENLPPGAPRMVRVAEAALTTLQGAGQLAAAAPGFGEPFAMVAVCEMLAGLRLDDDWRPPHLPFVPKAARVDEPWSPPVLPDALRAEPARLDGDGVVAVLGLHRLGAVEEAVRAAPAGAQVTLALVADRPSPLARLVVAELRADLRAAFPAAARPRLQIVHDDAGALAAAAGLAGCSDATEFAVRVAAGRIVARADGYGACYAAATG
ncbi:TetR/AcrR family transcriptional regulator [Actinoplanes auranticolor]|uniref:TetR family transcriptional regulator n=1 Tax=Actinoplanes auranticolor TaxID=47988 RepID=A0A919S9Z4_9ACTN|nr:TetR/AcrR family transcriptional regulator [Actinoplanes auranticolor]GIM67547.1 TetR family transcriptional regulator [Actinoplanes auranticolor]